tara:strand:- start:574 stop:3432 length:2859 start_codon:yes stop_codon:yes gene_type:complete
MSVQLELYPQSYEGISNSVTTSTITNYVADGSIFSTMNVSYGNININHNAAWTPASALSFNHAENLLATATTSLSPMTPFQWYRYRSSNLTLCAAGTYPLQISGDMSFGNSACTAAVQSSGIMQKLSGLTIGDIYTITVNVPSFTHTSVLADPYLFLSAKNGTTLQPIGSSGSSAGVVTDLSWAGVLSYNFTAQTTEDIICCSFVGGGPDRIYVSSITVKSTTTTNTPSSLTSGTVICDLYEDEDIPLTLSIDDFKNVAEKVQSYSKAFSLPATKRNSKIFDNIFEITRTVNGVIGFNPYVKTQCILREDGFVLFEGYLRLINVQDKEGEVSYDVNLYSEAVALADVLKVKDFVLLDFAELEHDYTITNIKASWTGALTYTNAATSSFRDGDTLKYPFVDWSHNFQYDSSFFPVLPNLEAAFRPFINIKYIIEKIFADTPFTFTSSFFDSADFEKLFMDFNWGDAPIPQVFDNTGNLWLNSDFALTASFQTIDFDQTTWGSVSLLPASFGYSSGVFTATAAAQTYTVNFDMLFVRSAFTSGTFQCEWVLQDASGVDIQIFNPFTTPASYSSYNYSGSFTTPPMAIGDMLFFRAKELVPNVEIDGNIPAPFNVATPLVTVTTGAANTSDATLLQALRGELNQWEFLKGIMTMFNLVTIPDKSNLSNILIEPYTDVFINNTNSASASTPTGMSLAARSIAHDWTDKIDISEIKLSPLTDLKKETIFKFVEDDDDYAFNLYRTSVEGHLYGSLKYTATAFTILEGQDEIIAEPFAATVIKPIMEQFADFIVPTIYSYDSSDGTSEGFDNSPRIMYNNGVKDLTSCTYAIPAQNQDSAIAAEDQFLQFSHLTAIPTVTTTPIPLATDTKDFNFGACQLIGPTPVADNLFSRYWQPYFGELYNADTRTMSIKVNLNAGDINTFNMYDTVFIKNRQFRVNKIDYKPNDLATVEFILIP